MTSKEYLERVKLRERAAQAGIDMSFQGPMTSSLDSLRLIEWVQQRNFGEEARERLYEAMQVAYFSEALALADHAVLLRAVDAAGLPHEEAEAVLNSDLHAASVREKYCEAYFLWNYRKVPVTLISCHGEHRVLEGALDVDTFEEAIKSVLSAGGQPGAPSLWQLHREQASEAAAEGRYNKEDALAKLFTTAPLERPPTGADHG